MLNSSYLFWLIFSSPFTNKGIDIVNYRFQCSLWKHWCFDVTSFGTTESGEPKEYYHFEKCIEGDGFEASGFFGPFQVPTDIIINGSYTLTTHVKHTCHNHWDRLPRCQTILAQKFTSRKNHFIKLYIDLEQYEGSVKC